MTDAPRRWVRFADAHRGAILTACLAATVAGAFGTARLYGDLRTDMMELLPRNSRAALDQQRVTERLGGYGEDAVVLYGDDKAALERFSDALAAKLAPETPSRIRWIEYRTDEAKQFYDTRRWLFPSKTDLEALRDRLAARIEYEKLRANPLYVSLDDDGPPGFDDIERRIDAGRPSFFTRFPDGYFVARIKDPDGREVWALSMLVRMTARPDDYPAVVALDRVVRAAVDGLHPGARGVRVAYAGLVAATLVEHQALAEDLLVATVLVFLAVAAALVVYYRTWKALPAVGIPLLAGTLATFGLGAVLVGHLNSNTAFLGSIVIGNGINVGIILFARHLEERRRGRPPRAAMEIAVDGTWRATLTAALAAGISYASLTATDFRGFNQFGLLGAVGMASCWLFAYVMTPPLVLAWERWRPLVGRREAPERALFTRAVAFAVERAPRGVLVASVLAAVVAALSVGRLARDPFEYDFAKLRDVRARLPGHPGWWDERVFAIYGAQLTPAVFLCDSVDEARQVHDALVARQRAAPGKTTLGPITWIGDFVPDGQAAKLPVLADIRAQLTPAVLDRLTDEERAKLGTLPPADLEPFTAAELPEVLRRRLVDKQGRLGDMVLVYPVETLDAWNGRDEARFAHEVRSVAVPRADIPLASPMLLFSDVLDSIRHDGPRATLASLGGVALLVVVSFGPTAAAAQVLGALALGVLWFLGLAGALGQKLNMLNFIALPITFGIGVDYATNVFQRRAVDPGRSMAAALRTTGGAVGLCSLTTIIGYSSLLVAHSQALRSFGVLADLGEAACLSAALFALPSLLALRERARRG